ncbi:MAG: beta-propeller fold lactonase family protein, partial [Pseudomonadota bacterium]
MRNVREFAKGAAFLAAVTLIGGSSASAGTFVYVSNADDGDISSYEMLETGALEPLARVKAAEVVMPMTVNPDKTILYAAARSEPYTIYSYAIDAESGALTPLEPSPLVDSMPYISIDNTGKFLLSASY